MVASVLPVADPSRNATRRALPLVLLCAGLFTAFAVLSTQIRELRSQSPWQDDPYDSVVSFTMAFVPLCTALLLLRVPLCRRTAPLPTSRLLAIQRAADVVLVAVAATLGTDWVAVATGTGRPTWGSSTTLLVGALAGLTLVAGAAAVAQWRARRSLARGAIGREQTEGDPAGPDWLDDAITLADLAGARISPAATRRIVRLARSSVDGRHGLRRHRLAAAVAAALAFGVAVAGSHQAAEGGGMPVLDAAGVFVLFTWIAGAGMLAFLLVAGWYLRLVRPLGARPARFGRRRERALAAAMAAVPLSVAFRAMLLPLLPVGLARDPVSGIGLLTIGAALLAGAAVLGSISAGRP